MCMGAGVSESRFVEVSGGGRELQRVGVVIFASRVPRAHTGHSRLAGFWGRVLGCGVSSSHVVHTGVSRTLNFKP